MSHKQDSRGSKKLSIWNYQLKSGLFFMTTTEVIFGEDGSFKGTVTVPKSHGIPNLAYDFACNREVVECHWREEQTLAVELIKEWFGLELEPDPASSNQSVSSGSHGPSKGEETGAGTEGQSHHHHSHHGNHDDGVSYEKTDGGSRTISSEDGGSGSGTQTGTTGTETGTGTATETQTAKQSGQPEIG